MKSEPRKGRRGASILLLSIVLMFVLLLLSITLFQLIPAEMHAANRAHADLNGHYVARAGIQETMSWLKFQMKKFDATQNEADLPDYSTNGTVFPRVDAFVSVANAKRPFTQGDWRYELEIIPQQSTFGLTNNFEARLFAVRSTSYLNDKPIKQVDVLLRQKTFASFAYYTEAFPSGSFIMNGESKIFGPVHTNDFFRFDTSGIPKDGTGTWTGDPYFTDIVTHSTMDAAAPAYGDGNRWIGGDPYTASGPTAGSYEAVFEGGRNDLRLKNNIDLPSSTDSLLNATWPHAATQPTDAGVHVSTDPVTGKVNGGIVINYAAQELNLRLDKYGNQQTVVRQGLPVGKNTVPKTKRVYYGPKNKACGKSCKTYGPPPSGGAGGAGGAAAQGPCIAWNPDPMNCQSYTNEPDGTQEVNDDDTFEYSVYEVTEAPIVAADGIVDENNNPVTASIGQTVIVRRALDQEGNNSYNGVTMPVNAWKTYDVEVLDGQINGNIYVSDRIGNESHRGMDNSERGVTSRGLWGIAKGSVRTDPTTGAPLLDTLGNKTYNNKAIITPLVQGKSISIGGDVLQFDPEKFAAEKLLGTDFSGQNGTTKARNWVKAALDPNRVTAGKPDPERSKNADHVLGIISLDVWMKGPTAANKNNNTGKELTANDGISDCYFVALAGKTEINPVTGLPRVVAGNTVTSGGFGTWRQHRDGADSLGEFRVIGGIIQGTLGANYNDSANDTHHWIDSGGAVGYSLNMFYDIEATRQRIFPVQSEFSIVRLLESSARMN